MQDEEKTTHLKLLEFWIVVLEAHCYLKVANLTWAFNLGWSLARAGSQYPSSNSELLLQHRDLSYKNKVKPSSRR